MKRIIIATSIVALALIATIAYLLTPSPRTRLAGEVIEYYHHSVGNTCHQMFKLAEPLIPVERSFDFRSRLSALDSNPVYDRFDQWTQNKSDSYEAFGYDLVAWVPKAQRSEVGTLWNSQQEIARIRASIHGFDTSNKRLHYTDVEIAEARYDFDVSRLSLECLKVAKKTK